MRLPVRSEYRVEVVVMLSNGPWLWVFLKAGWVLEGDGCNCFMLIIMGVICFDGSIN